MSGARAEDPLETHPPMLENPTPRLPKCVVIIIIDERHNGVDHLARGDQPRRDLGVVTYVSDIL